jgi:hypothetical protein
MGILDILNKVNDALDSFPGMSERKKAEEHWERTFGHKIGKPWEKVETYGEQKIRELEEKRKKEFFEFQEECAKTHKQSMLAQAEAERVRLSRIQELKQAFEETGFTENFAETSEVETLLTLTEKKIVQQCHRSQCHGCKLGWICPKFHFK